MTARARSDAYAEALLAASHAFVPEAEAGLGGEWRDTAVVDLREGCVERQRAALAAFIRTHEAIDDPENAVDLAIVLRYARKLDRILAAKDALVLNYGLLANLIFSGFSHVLSERVSPERRERAREKLLRYAGLADGYAPVTVEAAARIREGLARPGLIAPPRGMIEKDVAMTPVLLDDVAQRFRHFGIAGAGAALGALREQFAAYVQFLQTEVLPHARADFALPPALHGVLMESYGVTTPPAELAADARAQYARERDELERFAQSGELGPPGDLVTVLRRLKAEAIPADGLLAFYAERNRQLEAILIERKLIGLPDAPLRIEAMSEAESLSLPAPNMEPAALLDPAPARPRVRIPTTAADRPLDDFTYDGAAWPLMAHEARPGHELQFHRAQELELSLCRSIFADSANAEGWGLYAESIVEPFIPAAGRFATKLLRLMRTARAFLDPELHLGKLTVDDARRVLVDEIGASAALADSELFRYTQLIPGQATSYYFGFRAFQQFRAEMERELGPRFDVRRFHDAIMSAGCIPFDLMRGIVLQAFA